MRRIVIVGWIGLICCWAEAAESLFYDSKQIYRVIETARYDEGISFFKERLIAETASGFRLSPQKLSQFSTWGDLICLMELVKDSKVSVRVQRWCFVDAERLRSIARLLSREEDPQSFFDVLDKLLEHDSDACELYSKLALAIAAVMDDDEPPLVHDQMGQQILAYDFDPVERFTYFYELYESDEAKVAYEEVSVEELIYVVHVPVPISELAWVREHVQGSRSDWSQKYSQIVYDQVRLSEGQYDWCDGVYSLDAIRRKGGICVDQAYYAVLTARAYGIPALFFVGAGTSSYHAWFGYLPEKGVWNLDVARYRYSQYTTGYAFNPQTFEQLEDHTIKQLAVCAAEPVKNQRCLDYLSIARALIGDDNLIALRMLNHAKNELPIRYEPWKLEVDCMVSLKKESRLKELFRKFKDHFRPYPDILVRQAELIEDVLIEANKKSLADEIMKSLKRGVDDERDDLHRYLEESRIRKIIRSGDVKRSRRELEQFLDERMEEGSKILSIVRTYVIFCESHDQTRQCVKFIDDYIEELLEKHHFSPGYERNILRILKKAYLNDGNDKKAKEVDVMIERVH